ncbi:LOW QUALITY PROTEIN: uncharacterized protein LOC105429319 [Pogonomyrmex barbatus]|uniref:LOW QUALITY PROTEIN: uncharacterized protein LOC105429319 n=1 Tax=Pogonomyrmex barbatus TaxID=144034 RepID=A0A6I9WDR7_9HYME|nr:LOW QUALITY PROTEIN: uncharacterized protein LOC105429319 [Pogonomyrmex barbatus]
MDEYDRKFAEMQKYIPFLEAMIERLQNVKDKDNREIQLQKMQSLHGILSNSKRKLKIETLQRCEDVLQKLYNRVEKFQGNTPGLQLPSKQNYGITSQPSTSKNADCKEAESSQSQSQDTEKNKKIETPESPDTTRSSSPDCQIVPIIIPTERNDLERNKDRRQKHRSKIIPIITLTDSTKTITISSSSDSNSEDTSFTEWDMLEESERHNSRNRGDRQSFVTSHDVATAAKLVSSNLPQKINDSRNYALDSQNIPTVPVPSLGGSRRLSSVLEKNKLNLDIMVASSSRPESPLNVPEVRLNSPDPEILYANPTVTSPRSKDNHNAKSPSKSQPSIPLLFSPPPLSHEPPLSMEDLAELLNEGDGEKSDKGGNNAAKQKETDKDKSKNFPSDRDRITVRKNLTNMSISPVKSSEIKGPPHQSNDPRSVSQALFLGSRVQEPRYADNYERHPRQRDPQVHEKDKSVTSSAISEEMSSQMPVFHNAANKPDERNVPLYQRRPSAPSDARKDVTLPRDNEFVIDNTDYYNMHMNQMHWASTAATGDHQHQFGNNQWTPSAYGGIPNPPLQPIQHSFQHPIESQFRPNQFPANLPAGPRPLINPVVRPQEMNHGVRPENIREDIPPLMPPGFSSQYRGFQMGQGSYDPGFPGRPTEYPHVRPTWEGPTRVNETPYENVIPCGIQVVENSTGTAYPRPNTPCPWGTRDRDRSNRTQGREGGYYDRNRTEVRPGFNRDGRPINRFSNPRDPRVRTEHNANQAKETSASVRDPRLAKDKHVNTSVKTKDTVHNERDPRKRPVTSATKAISKGKPKSQKSSEKEEKKERDKLPKDRMQSPLESLYGVIDTKASHNSGLQKFKIPKIKRPEPPQSIRKANEAKEVESVPFKSPRPKSNSKKSNKFSSKNTNKNIASGEVSSSSDSNPIVENLIQNDEREGEILSSSHIEKTNKNDEVDSATNNLKLNDIAEKSKRDESKVDGSKSKEEVNTQELIQAFVRKSFESGEGKMLVEQAKLLQQLGKGLKAEKFKKIKKIIESESDSSSDKDETVETKKIKTKKKRRVIVSDSSDDECLAERLSILNTNIDVSDEREPLSASSTDPKSSKEKLEAITSGNKNEEQTKNIIRKKNDGSLKTHGEGRIQANDNKKNKGLHLEKNDKKNDRLGDSSEKALENKKRISSIKDSDKENEQTEDKQDKVDQNSVEVSKDTSNAELDKDQDKNRTDRAEFVSSDPTSGQADEGSSDKPKAKTKRRNSLEMLQEDIREMFISESVMTATGYRMCRMSKEGQSPSGMSTSSINSKKEEVSNTAEKKIVEPNTERDESANKLRKSLRARNVEESSKAKVTNRKDAKLRTTRNSRSKEFVSSSESEEDQPLALRTRLSNVDNRTSNQEVDHSEESNDALRRSKRIIDKYVKEPRVLVEKTDITKLDSSKVMFDSSSDESFGIDVSELAAAVDISLRPDKQSDQDSIDTTASTKRSKDAKRVGKRNSKSKKSFALTDDKSEDGTSLTDEESIVSDISMSSGTTARKRTIGGAARTTAKEDLLSNILMGLAVPTERNTSLTDKGSEIDFDEDANDPLAIEPGVKKLPKKKKKKSSWQMGIVTTKKKKRKAASASKATKTSTEETSAEANVSTDTAEGERSITKDKNLVAAKEKISEVAPQDNCTVNANLDSTVKCEEIKPLVNISADSFNVDVKEELNNSTVSDDLLNTTLKDLLDDSLLSIEENKSTVKMEIEAESERNVGAPTATHATTVANRFSKESPKIIYDQLMTDLFRRIDSKHLIDYAWVGPDKYKCLLCFFTGKNIVHHYKVNHPEKEILISRLRWTDAEAAVADAERASATGASQMCKFCCRFCCFVTEGAADVALEAFYEHCTTHTGEYRFHCNNCSYQAVAKASMKTHYYKVCRRDKSFNESASEDIIPKENGVYGYLCRTCNFVQLKRQNVEAHVAFWHREQANIEIVKINMSAVTVEMRDADKSAEQPRESAKVGNAEEPFVVEAKPQISEFESVECKNVPLIDTSRSPPLEEPNDDNIGEGTPHEPKTFENIQVKDEEIEERSKLSQGEPEGPSSGPNLSAFVCPPELEDKEIEIQRERQKTMQEIANDIGILLKNFSKPGLSIIDKLQDKMRTDAVVSPVPECNNAQANVPENSRENSSLPLENLPAESLKVEETIIKEDPLSQPSSQEDSSVMGKQLAADKSQEVTNEGENDKADVKIRDPLATIDSRKDNEESDGENSDNEHSAPIFETESSSEQSDAEPTDVNMILKETSSMTSSSSRVPMLTTIQRLAAQLQNVKPLEPVPEPTSNIQIKSEPVDQVSLIPKPPDVVPIASVKRLLKRQKRINAAREALKPASYKNASPPKNFIRFRRLSGDMLSMPTFPDKEREDGAQSDSAIDASQTDTEEGCSFLKIENVISLAPKSNRNKSENLTVRDIRKAVERSPIKNKEISVLRKSNHQPLILKKTIPPQLVMNTNMQVLKKSVIISSAGPSTSNNRSRKLKLVGAPVMINSKEETSLPSFVIKLKSVEAYTAMLTEPKLVHFYKCMGQDCSFTTDSIESYHEHYNKHCEEADKKNSPAPHDYKKCAYCQAFPKDWRNMKYHLWEKHAHCQYQCSYCFYRAIIPSYVQQHQAANHPGTVFYCLLGTNHKSIPMQEDIHRNTYMKPFVCKHDCNKIFYVYDTFMMHLRTKHWSYQFMYKCHLCNSTYATIEILMSHYKTHGYSKYQCIYCLHGTETQDEMLQHLSFSHCDRLPQTLERSLPPMPSRNVDVIKQLILRNLVKLEENVNLSVDDSKKNTTTKKDTTNDKTSTVSLNVNIVSNQDRRDLSNSLASNFVGEVKDEKANANVPNISAKQPIDPPINTDEKTSKNVAEKHPQSEQKLFLQSETEKLSDYAINQILQEPELELLTSLNDSNAVDPLEFSNEFNSNDEFVNTNLLDNVEFLKNFTSNSGNVSFFKDKIEDSDIEILESEEKAAQRDVKDDAKQTIKPVLSETKADNKEQILSKDPIEKKCTSEETRTTNAAAQSEKPLTLDDIKNTGRAGLDLYKCGYLECNFAASNAMLLKAHMKTCTFEQSSKYLFCPHCPQKKRLPKIGLFLEHMKSHGLKRFGCSLCKLRYSVSYQATAHMRTKHKLNNTKLVPADPTNPSVDGLFIVQAVPFGSAERKTKKRKGAKSGAEQENEKSADEKLSFNPDEIEQLPRQAIYNREVQCAVCPYTTKVRTNIIRHLQLHAKDETVPESGPVNPVPCLDKKEKMFDKMVNLASSSHQNGRMGAKPKEPVKENEEDDSIPKFVPEHKRYVCGVAECNYLTVDEAMLRYHLKALHSEEPYFRCPHCPPSGQENQNIAIDKMGIHLKMHDARLYKCSHCNHHHYHRHVVERHLTDKHPEKRPFVKVIREIENTENIQQQVQEEVEEEIPDPDGNHWKCNLCDFKCVYKADVATHADTVHSENCQYKCTLCSFKTSGKIHLEQHINSKHAYDSNADYAMTYQRIKGVNKRNAETVEQSGQDEPFDTTPLWRRSMPRIRHIRGILLEEEIEIPATSETPVASKVSASKRKNDSEISVKPAKIKLVGKSTSLDDNNKQAKEKSKRSLSCDETEGEEQVTKENGNKSAKNSKTATVELSDAGDSDVGRFGPYGKPDANMYVCTLCNTFKTKYKHDMRDHIYRELNYPRWHCKTCGYLSINRKALLQHFTKRHNGKFPEHEPLSPDNAIEDWVKTLLKKQTDLIKAYNAVHKNVAIPFNTNSSSPDVSPVKVPVRVPDIKTANFEPSITNFIAVFDDNLLEDANKNSMDTDDGDSQDENLVIDMKEDEAQEDKNNDDKSENEKLRDKIDEELEKPLVCKHCQMTFNRQRGFKLHIQYSHLKRLGFLCPYCDRSTNSETMMRQHIRAKHPKDPEKIIHNPDAWGNAKLTNEFWEKEYGLICPKSVPKKRKMNTDANSNPATIVAATASTVTAASIGNRLDTREKCDICNFTAVNHTGLKSHMRTHTAHKNNLKCVYCTYSCSFKAEMLEHWELNHPSLQLKYKELSSTASSSSDEMKNSPSMHKNIDATLKNEEQELTSTIIYGCFYCNLRSISLQSIKQHWNLMHKEAKSSETGGSSTKFPFRYKEIPVQKMQPINPIKKDIVESLRDLTKKTENSSPVIQRYGWLCQWCNDFCETDNDRITHQNMYHSHLPQNFKRREWQEQQQQQKEQDQPKGTSIPITSLSTYSSEKHPSLKATKENISNFESVVENLIAIHVTQNDLGDTKIEDDQSRIFSATLGGNRRRNVARKSTTKSVISYARPGPRIFKAVARKSTNPRYPPSVFTPRSLESYSMDTDTDSEDEKVAESNNQPVSHYRIPSSPVNLAALNTYMVVGGHNMRVNCLTLATLINIKPRVLLKDIRKNPKYAAILSSLN